MALVRRKTSSNKNPPAIRSSYWDDDFNQFAQRMFSPVTWRGFEDFNAMANLDFPRVDMADDGKHVSVTAELPGVELKDLNLELTEDTLVITGEKKREFEENDQGWYRNERSYGYFRRELPLSSPVDRDSVKATFKNGVLEVKMNVDGRRMASRSIPIAAK